MPPPAIPERYVQARTMRIAASILLIFALVSCAIEKSKGTFSKEEGLLYYHQSNPEVGCQVFGDYFVHAVDSKYFRDVPNAFLKYATRRTNSFRPQLLFAAHTIVSPYYSTIGTIYKGANLDSAFVEDIRNNMKSLLNVTKRTYETVYTNYGSAIVFDYEVLNSTTKIRTSHKEYLVNDSGNVIRFCFWTTEKDTEIPFGEAEGVVKKLKL